LVTFKKNSYFDTFRTGKTIETGAINVEVVMVDLTIDGLTSSKTFTTGNSAVVYLNQLNSPINDTLIFFPANLRFIKEDKSTYTGNVNVNALYLDPTHRLYSKVAPGGDQLGRVLNDKQDYYLNPYGGLLVQLSDDNGNKINLASDNTSQPNIYIPIPSSYQALAPVTIDLWYSGGDLVYASGGGGGSGKKRGPKYVSSVAHFSMWSFQEKDKGFGTITGKVTDCNQEPIAGVRIQVGKSYAITDNAGKYSCTVPSGTNIPVQILDEDHFGNGYYQTLNSLSAGKTETVDISLECMSLVTGRVVNCSGLPIEAQVVIYDENNISKTYTTDGNFKLQFPSSNRFTLVCKTDGYEILKIYTEFNLGDIMVCKP
jgi:hypothetical protein